MITLFSALLLLQQASAQVPDSVQREHARMDSLEHVERHRDSVYRARRRAKRDVPVTPELLASAYKDAEARALVMRARSARTEQDSSLESYDAMSRERLSVGISFRATAPDKLLLRSENASRVRWQRGRGAIVNVVGARTAFPMFYQGARVLQDFLEMDPVPYFPGREGLLQFGGENLARKSDEGLYIHPLDRGAEAYYTFAIADSVSFRLPDGTRIRLRAVDVEARKPSPDLIVGTLWFDVSTGQLVRGAFRPAAPLDIRKFVVEEADSTAFEDVPTLVKPLIFPMEMSVAAFTVEYGLHERRWWLPRSESVQGRARAGFTYAGFSLERSFTYASVNGPDTIPRIFRSIEDSMRHTPGDTTYRMAVRISHDSLMAARDSARHAEDSIYGHQEARRRREKRAEEEDPDMARWHCSGTDSTIRRGFRYEGSLPIQIIVPCDTTALLHSAELPPTIYDPGTEVFDVSARNELASQLTMKLQPGWDPQPVQWHYGIDNSLIRYNRVDALDAGVMVSRDFGSGYTGDLTARVSIGGPEFYGEAHMRRSDGFRTYDVGLYRRLAFANDWGDPLTFRASLNAFVLGQDLGFYYNTWGAELRSVTVDESHLTWRVYAEQQSNAPVTTNVSIPNWINGHEFTYNVQTPMTNTLGAQGRYRREFGLDPQGWRESIDGRVEGAFGKTYDSTFGYGRLAVDGTVSHGITRWLTMQIGGGAGTSVGDLPPQRDWFLGGAWTIRGQPPGTAVGNAYWMGHVELGSSFAAVRPTLFFDIGWSGDRNDWQHVGIPVSGAGAGVSFMDGLFRIDLAHAIQPTGGWILDFGTGTRF